MKDYEVRLAVAIGLLWVGIWVGVGMVGYLATYGFPK